ncbi:MAG: hypothetical protein OXI76_02105 [Gemmatimonadota bacterium]|nr:hypothetical protein [Gemmatimonadota bacterium]
MKNPRPTTPVAVLALPFVLTACTGVGGDLANDEQVAADREAAEAMVRAVLDIHAGHMNNRRPARLLLGSWEYIAGANTDWSQRLAMALRGLEEEMMGDSPEAPWLVSYDVLEEEALFAVYDTEDRSHCCPTVAVRVWLRNGKLEFRASDRVGYIDFVDPPQTVVASVLAEEEQYLRDRKAGEQVPKKRGCAHPQVVP